MAHKLSLALLFIYLLYTISGTDARLVWGVSNSADGSQNLIQFDSATPTTLLLTYPLVLNESSERLVGIDVRPSNGLLYGVSNASRLYIINADGTSTYQFTLAEICAIDNGIWAVDFNPSADALRLVSGTKNYRLTSIDNQRTCFNDGAVMSMPSPTDVVNTYSVAYSSNFKGTTATNLYALVSINGGDISLGQITNPNGGNFENNVALSVAVTPAVNSVAFDSYYIYGDTSATSGDVYLAALRVGGVTSLYTLELTGAATVVGTIGTGADSIVSISAALNVPFPFSAAALVDNTLVSFGISNPTATAYAPINGATEDFLAITLRPATYQIYAITATSRLYILYPYSATNVTAVLVGTLNCTLQSSASNIYSMDFNPAADRLRIVSSTGENYRVNADNAACFIDGNLFYVSDGSTPRALGVAYTNGFRSADPAATGTAEYIIDGNDNSLARVVVPNNGNSTKIGSGNDVTIVGAPFDIFTQSGNQYGYFAANGNVHSMDLATGVIGFVVNFANSDVQPTGFIAYPSDYAVPAFPTAPLEPLPTVFSVMVLTSANSILSFTSNAPSSSNELPVILPAGVELLTITLRPVSYQIYGISNTSDLFILYPYATNVTAYYVGTLRCTLSPSATNIYSADFNPAADRLRIVSSTGENYRVNVADAGCIVDGKLHYESDSSTPQAVGVAYTNGFNSADPPTLGTAEYIIDATGSRLSRVTAPNNGTTNAIGALGWTVGTHAPFDILTFNGQQYGYAVTATQLAFINLATGASSVVAQFSSSHTTSPLGVIVFPTDYVLPALPDAPIRIAVPFVFNAVALVGNSLSSFSIFSSANINTVPISLPSGENLLGITLRPSNYQIYGVSGSGNIYVITPNATAATAVRVATLTGCSLTPSSTNVYSFDFNPAADLLRIVSSTGQNFRVNVQTGSCTVDGNLFYIDGVPVATPTAAGVAYTNGFRNPNAATAGTAEFILDARNGGAFFSRVVAPNSGNTTLISTLTAPTALALPTPFDILTVNGLHYGYAATANSVVFIDLDAGFSQAISSPVFTAQPSGFIVYPRDYALPGAPTAAPTTAPTTPPTTAPVTTTSTTGVGMSTSTTGSAPSSTSAASVRSVVSSLVVIVALALYLC